jgi:hypothetical protein
MVMKRKPLAERLRAKLKTLGFPERKATEVAKKLAPVAAKPPAKGTVFLKLVSKLEKLGLSDRKAKTVAKGLSPLVKAEHRSQAADPKAPKVPKDLTAPLDLPVAPMEGIKGIELMRVMNGLSSTATYLVAAVKGDVGIVAIRKFSDEYFNVKFYPNMRYWNRTPGELEALAATDYLQRQWYERMHFSNHGLAKLLVMLQDEAKPKSRMKNLMDRFMAVAFKSLFKAFDKLYSRAA